LSDPPIFFLLLLQIFLPAVFTPSFVKQASRSPPIFRPLPFRIVFSQNHHRASLWSVFVGSARHLFPLEIFSPYSYNFFLLGLSLSESDAFLLSLLASCCTFASEYFFFSLGVCLFQLVYGLRGWLPFPVVFPVGSRGFLFRLDEFPRFRPFLFAPYKTGGRPPRGRIPLLAIRFLAPLVLLTFSNAESSAARPLASPS